MDIDTLIAYITKSWVTALVLGWLSIYFIASFTILFSRWISISSWKKRENNALESLLMGMKIPNESILQKCCNGKYSKSKFDVVLNYVQKQSTSGLTWLSIIASTSPFIGLFGTVISILQTFSQLSQSSSLSIIAPAISEALVATGCGIFVAIPAYTFNLILKRKSFELLSVVDQEINILLDNQINNDKI